MYVTRVANLYIEETSLILGEYFSVFICSSDNNNFSNEIVIQTIGV